MSAADESPYFESDENYQYRTENICDQLRRYHGGVENPHLLDALEAITNINDDLARMMSQTVVLGNIDKAIAHLQAMREKFA